MLQVTSLSRMGFQSFCAATLVVRNVVPSLFRLMCTLVSLCVFLPGALAQPAMPPVVRAPEEIDMLAKMSAGSSEVAAAMLSVAEIGGKPISSGAPGRANAPKLKDAGIGTDPTKDHTEPTVAANPRADKYLVAGSHYVPGPSPNNPSGLAVRCVAYTSNDNGANWSAPILAPHLPFPASAAPIFRNQSCSDPVIRYAPDGSRVYYSYMDIKVVTDFTAFPASFTQTVDFDIVVSYSDNNGTTWSAPPVTALDGDPYTVFFTPCPSPPFPPGSYCGVITDAGYAFDKNWIGVHPVASEANWVYATATRFNTPGFPEIAFARSGNKGASFSPHIILDSGSAVRVVQGSHPAGGVRGQVLVAWYDSDADGWLNGGFRIRTRRSSDHGATFDPVVTAATDSFELPFWLGPFTMHKRWWGGMFPALEIDSGGRAHIVYTHDPVANGICILPGPGGPIAIAPCSTTAEDGDIRYLSSGPPYGIWSAPRTVNDDGLVRAQGYPGLVTQYGGNATLVHVVWEDSRQAPETPVTPAEAAACLFTTAECNSSNGYYDLFYGRKVPGGLWMPNFRVSEVSSRQDFIFTGDYTDVGANETTLFAVWTDRRHQTNTKPGRDNVFGSRIIAGGGTTSH